MGSHQAPGFAVAALIASVCLLSSLARVRALGCVAVIYARFVPVEEMRLG